MAEQLEESGVTAIGRIAAVPTILDLLCSVTGMGFAAVARVTEQRWVACSVRDAVGLGLGPGGELDIGKTICQEVRSCREAVMIDHVAQDPEWRDHPVPALYGFQSYVSMPIILPDGSFFGTLCALDPKPVKVRTPQVTAMFSLFAELIAFHLDSLTKVESSQAALLGERETAALREQFIAVLGHDLRNPLAAIEGGVGLLEKEPLGEKAQSVLRLVRQSAERMQALIDDVLDLARGRLGGGISLQRRRRERLGPVLNQVVAELRTSHPDRAVEAEFDVAGAVLCDRSRLAQLFSNLIGNALVHGDASAPVRIEAALAEDQFIFSVANAGPPIDAEAMKRLFEPFSRGEVRPSGRGLGLGLYICAEIARAHGGTLDARSTEEGTRFTFRMPAA